jgi:hypothetical protein
MVFTLASQLKELLAEMLVKRRERIAKEDEERFRREEEVRVVFHPFGALLSLPSLGFHRPHVTAASSSLFRSANNPLI